ncbi:glycosyltransferase family 4 protein [Pedobacter africanus]|uniref:Glycosyltransferase involved in cell wall biosynthesis n=1 Tax=Pedobacter africanus TaxID=151894 RepID=A0ACC6L3N9_9SPHI|nr:glycosyltransferase family 1 protein [Pedobacter africanus]MDR6785969.1 glycosyltransferase involved in cell wall biosynthesis [Pedobacter africanus]
MFDLQNYGGISRYFANLILAIQQRGQFQAELPIVRSTNYYLRDFPQLFNNYLGKKLLKKGYNRIKWNKKLAIAKIRQNKYDIFHATYYDPYFLPSLKKPLVITVHDMIYENFPHQFRDAAEVIARKHKLIKAADLIIAISQYTKKEILKYYPLVEDKIHVIYHGLPESNIVPANEHFPENFLLYVGDRYAPYKNFKCFIEGVTPIIKTRKNLFLICAGGGSFNEAELRFLQSQGLSEKVIQLNATDAVIMQLYQKALLFVYPSLEEGFGLPLLEAFKNGCAVACSGTSCLPEVAGDAAVYFDPLDIGSITKTLSNLLDNEDLRKLLIANGYKRNDLFAFDACVTQTIACYNHLLRSA